MSVSTFDRLHGNEIKSQPPDKSKASKRGREISPPDINRSLGNSYLQSLTECKNAPLRSHVPQTRSGTDDACTCGCAGLPQMRKDAPARAGQSVGTAQAESLLSDAASSYRKKGTGAATISGGISGIVMDVKVTYADCTDCKDGLEAIQVFWGTRRTDSVQVGKHTTVFPPLATTYDTFVDGGKNSPGGAVYSGDHPYYMGRADLPAKYGYIPAQKSAGTFSGCTINVKDAPGAVSLHDQAYFETAIVCLNFDGTGTDKVQDAFKWGFTGKGASYLSSPVGGKASGLETSTTPSAKFEETLKADYPGYTHT
jgi:hypothetical protein